MGQQVTEILGQAFKGIDTDLQELPGGRVSGRVVWEGFAELDPTDRQKLVREVLKKELGPRVQEVGVLLTYTPTELEAMQAA